ncbi:tetratricopeptide repeat protein [Pseudodesulfovibrio tunisiensis]|uniref:tetratricopeptide repeat protein n=1 Tax=Pseudodesulfovibrio tunisiensis TaxID=463192 RepID=UPI001FB38FF9|nr:tetratricopeptide repeat protein [Pseudodesulfovibrio tunisiensis]
MADRHQRLLWDFLENRQGTLVCVSDDATFARSLRNIVTHILGIRRECQFTYQSPQAALERIRQLAAESVPCVALVERMFGASTSTGFVQRLGREHPETCVVLLTWEARSDAVAYLFELGVDNVICKPASADRIIEQLAQCISPPGELKSHMERCRRLIDTDNPDEALEVTDRILMLKPDSARGLCLRADALLAMGETDKAARAYIDAHENNPLYLRPLKKLAGIFKDMDDDKALTYLKELDAISPLNPDRKLEIAEVHLRRDEPEQAEEYLDQSVEMATRENADMLGEVAERIADIVAGEAPALAEKYLNNVIRAKRGQSVDDLILYNRLGIVLRSQGKWREAVDVYRKALRISPKDAVLHYNLGLALHEGGERMRALECFEKTLEIDPDFHKEHDVVAFNMGSLYLDLRMYEDALPFLEHAVELAPDNAAASHKLKQVRAVLEKYR